MSAYKNYYFGKMEDGTWILGESLKDKITPGPYKQTFSSNGEVELIGVKNQSTGEFEAMPRPVTNYTDLDGVAYANYEAFDTATKDFFFKLGGSVVTSNGLIFTDSETGLRGRAVFKDGQWFFDKELTPTGFDGVQSTDGGVTGDWMTSGGF